MCAEGRRCVYERSNWICEESDVPILPICVQYLLVSSGCSDPFPLVLVVSLLIALLKAGSTIEAEGIVMSKLRVGRLH